jgi:hypothetical protein
MSNIAENQKSVKRQIRKNKKMEINPMQRKPGPTLATRIAPGGGDTDSPLGGIPGRAA